jgi:hypothetical protein
LTYIPPRGIDHIVVTYTLCGYLERNIMTTSEYQVSGMSCGHCEAAVQA